MRLMTSVEDVSVEVTGLSVLTSVKSPQMTRPPVFGVPPAGFAASVGAGAGGALGAGADVAGVAWFVGPPAASTMMLALSVETMRPATDPRNRSIEIMVNSPFPQCLRPPRASPPAPARRPRVAGSPRGPLQTRYLR